MKKVKVMKTKKVYQHTPTYTKEWSSIADASQKTGIPKSTLWVWATNQSKTNKSDYSLWAFKRLNMTNKFYDEYTDVPKELIIPSVEQFKQDKLDMENKRLEEQLKKGQPTFVLNYTTKEEQQKLVPPPAKKPEEPSKKKFTSADLASLFGIEVGDFIIVDGEKYRLNDNYELSGKTQRAPISMLLNKEFSQIKCPLYGELEMSNLPNTIKVQPLWDYVKNNQNFVSGMNQMTAFEVLEHWYKRCQDDEIYEILKARLSQKD